MSAFPKGIDPPPGILAKMCATSFLHWTSITSNVKRESLFWEKLWLNLKLFLQRKTFFFFQITYVPQENIEVIRNTKIVHPQVITYFKSSKHSAKQIPTFV
jgi:hypothetical protein